jgi:hypothetical protein
MINGIHISIAVTDIQPQPMTEALPDSNTLLLRFIKKQFSKSRGSYNHDTITVMRDAS